MNIFQQIAAGLKKPWEIIASPNARNAVEQAASLVSIALPIVGQLSGINPGTAKLKALSWVPRSPGISHSVAAWLCRESVLHETRSA
jgi:hypothetical protein